MAFGHHPLTPLLHETHFSIAHDKLMRADNLYWQSHPEKTREEKGQEGPDVVEPLQILAVEQFKMEILQAHPDADY